MSYRWLKNYEKSRFKQPKEPNQSWLESKYGGMGLDWREVQQIYIPSLKMCVGPAWNKLKRLWKNYKISGHNGESRTHVAYEINRYQAGLDLPRSDFPELEGIVSDYEFEDQQISESLEPNPNGWSDLDQQLMKEKQEAEAEAEADDDWWISD